MANAPVVLFAYNRPDHLRRAFDALVVNQGFDDTPVFVYSDGPRTPLDRDAVERVRDLVKASGHPNVTLVEAPENLGLYGSVIHGVTRLVDDFGRVIVVEDDLVTSPAFLGHMNAALDRYERCERVLQICGFGVRANLGHGLEAFFTPLASSWGWATWKRAWDGFMATDFAAAYERLHASADLRRRFDLGGRYPMYFMFRRNFLKRNESWAVPWQLYILLQDGLALWPARSFVQNIGSDGGGAHSRWSRKDATMSVTDLALRPVQSFPDRLEVDPDVWRVVADAVVAANPAWHRWLSAVTRRFP